MPSVICTYGCPVLCNPRTDIVALPKPRRNRTILTKAGQRATLFPQTFFKVNIRSVIALLPFLICVRKANGKVDCIERVHIYACNRLLGVNINTPNAMVCFETGRLSLLLNAQEKMMKYLLRLLQMHSHRYSKQCYDMMVMQESRGIVNWISSVKKCVNELGFGHVSQSQNLEYPDQLIQIFTQRLKDTCT